MFDFAAIVPGIKLLNLGLAIALLSIVVMGLVFMRGREAYQLSGRYAMYGLAAFAIGGLVAALGNYIDGEQQELVLLALAARFTALVYLTTHVIYNIKLIRRAP